jgi:hypothetical protein
MMKHGEVGYNIFEKETDTLIELERTEKETRDICRKLNLGAGFNGWTPRFFSSRFGTAPGEV